MSLHTINEKDGYIIIDCPSCHGVGFNTLVPENNKVTTRESCPACKGFCVVRVNFEDLSAIKSPKDTIGAVVISSGLEGPLDF